MALHCGTKWAYPCFLNQSVQCANTSSIPCRHTINFVHDQASLVRNLYTCHVGSLEVVFVRVSLVLNATRTPSPPSQPSSDEFIMFVLFWRNVKPIERHEGGVRTSTSFLLRASLALSSIGVKPSSLAQRCALVVLPIPGGPVMSTALKIFIPFFPGFLKPDFRLDDLV